MGSTKLYPIKISHEDFLKIPEAERLFFVQLGCLCNDLMLFHRLLLALDHREASSDALKRGNSSLNLSVTRLLAGRLYEGWQMLQTSYFGNGVSKSYTDALETRGAEALKAIKRYFSGSNLLGTVRNKFAYHTDPDEIIRSMGNLNSEMDLTVYLSEKQGNTLYWFADEILANGMLTIVEDLPIKETLEKLYDDSFSLAKEFLAFASYSMWEFVQRHLHITIEECERNAIILEGLGSLQEIKFPFYVEEG